MKSLKLQSLDTGKTKYKHVADNYPIEIGETIRFKWNKVWKVLNILYDPINKEGGNNNEKD